MTESVRATTEEAPSASLEQALASGDAAALGHALSALGCDTPATCAKELASIHAQPGLAPLARAIAAGWDDAADPALASRAFARLAAQPEAHGALGALAGSRAF